MTDLNALTQAMVNVTDLFTRLGFKPKEGEPALEDMQAKYVFVVNKALNEAMAPPPEAARVVPFPITPAPTAPPDRVAPAAAPDRAAGERVPGYDDFADVLEKYGIPVPDGMRRWFTEVGGWDVATDAIKTEILTRMTNYYEQRNPNSDHDTSKCYACGSPGSRKTGRNGDFYVCSKGNCGFEGRDGFVKSQWDDANWQEKRDRMRSAGRGRGRR